jgi:S1-C subfamily serine protease
MLIQVLRRSAAVASGQATLLVAVLAWCTGCSANPWLGAEIKREGPAPDAAALIQASIDAQGGQAAFDRVSCAMHSGAIGIPQLGWSGTFTVWQKKPRMVLQEAEINGVGQFITGTDGQLGWNISSNAGVKLMSQVELDHFVKTSGIGVTRGIADGCEGAVVTRLVSFAGQAAWEVALNCPEGRRTAWINAATNLPVGFAIAPVASNSVIPMVVYMDDWMDFEGLRLPRYVASRSSGITIEMRKMVSSTAAIGDERFAPPPAVCSIAGIPLPALQSPKQSAASPTIVARSASVPLGTGFFVNGKGLVVTSDHVIDGASEVVVIDSIGKSWEAKVLQRAPAVDIAVLKIDGTPPGSIAFADSSQVALGQQVFTIGFPMSSQLGVSPKYTEGTISSTSGPSDFADAFQISVPVQHGNSGGPIADFRGNVVGIVRSGVRGDLWQNVSWAVKANLAAALLPKSELETQDDANDREAAIQRVSRAVCRIEGKK